jgi:hypothetical protein
MCRGSNVILISAAGAPVAKLGFRCQRRGAKSCIFAPVVLNKALFMKWVWNGTHSCVCGMPGSGECERAA